MNAPRASSFPLSTPARTPCCADKRRSGFALLITITLLAFLVLLLVSLASLTRVETQVAANNQQLAQARQNALLALNIALGQLQKYAGPDQRTTARADLDATLANTTTANGRWTAVYGSAVAPDYTDTPLEISDKLVAAYDAADPLLKKGSQARLLNWLVSGNENTAFNPSADVAADGHITDAPDTFSFTPASAVNLATASTSPGATDAQALLVGANSVTAASDFVAGPLRPISVPSAQIPGAAATGADVPVGRYAWWIGDENTKARLNLSVTAATAPAHAFVTAQRAAVELVDGINPVGSTAAFAPGQLIGTSAYDPSSATIPRLLNPAQLPMLSSANATALETARKFRFHDLTATSQTVLTDTYAGGLKKDLSAVLETAAASPADTDHLFPPASTGARDVYGVPTWGKLRSFAKATNGVSPLVPRLPSTTDVGIAPVMTYIALGFEYVNLGGSLRLAVFPVVVLWNPYTTPIAGARYEVGAHTRGGRFQLQSAPASTGPWTAKETRNLYNSVQLNNTGTKDTYVRFEVDASSSPLLPGESRIFTLQGTQSGGDYNAPVNGPPQNILTAGINILGHVLLPHYGAAVLPGETAHRVAGDGSQHVKENPTDPNYTANFRNEMSAYLGQLSATAPLGPEMPHPDKPWYQMTALVAMSGTAASPVLQDTVPNGVTGANLWGVSVQLSFGNRVRWMANNNPRAPFMSKTALPGTRAMISKQGRDTHFQLFSFDPTPDGRASSATGLDVNTTTDTPRDNILYEFRPADQPLLSLGQLQHANLSWHQDIPGYPLGNSLADMFFLNSNKTDRDRLHRGAGSSAATAPTNLIGGQYDISYLLNRSLWDRYFVSTVPHLDTGTSTDTNSTGIPDTLPNARLLHDDSPDLRDADKAAAHLLLTGGFNINSTSEQAWRAVLGGINRLDYNPEDPAGTSSPLNAALPRFSRPPVAPAYNATEPDWAFKGYRGLTEEQIARLASEIVREVRNRGPFISLADFVNRRLKDNPDSTTHGAPLTLKSDETVKGPLQAAIDAVTSGGASINNHRGTTPFNSAINDDAGDSDQLDNEGLVGGRSSADNPAPPIGAKSAFAAHYLTQADVLSAIGAGLSARSDTFTVRTYGDVLNPVTGDITGRAWCEAVVQRTVEPLRRKSTVTTSADYNEPAAPTAAQPDFGRRFQIISFRWLSSSDI